MTNWVDELGDDLLHVRCFEQASSRLADAAFRRMGVKGVTVFPLFAGARPELEASFTLEDWEPDAARARLFEALAVSDEDLGPVASLFADRSAMDCNAVLEPRGLRKTKVYNEFWRPDGVERQLLALMGSPSAPLGYLCLCRGISDRPFSDRELLLFDTIRGRMEAACLRIAGHRRGWVGLDSVLQALRVAVPQPCGLFDSAGRAIWLNASAEREFGMHSTAMAGGVLPPTVRPQLARWSAAALAAKEEGGLDAWEGEGVTVRRVDRLDGPALFLVLGDGTKPRRIPGLTEREHEVAELAGRGYSALNIAARLGLSEETVRNHLKKIYRKLGISSRVELASALWASGGIARFRSDHAQNSS